MPHLLFKELGMVALYSCSKCFYEFGNYQRLRFEGIFEGHPSQCIFKVYFGRRFHFLNIQSLHLLLFVQGVKTMVNC